MNRIAVTVFAVLVTCAGSWGQKVPLLNEKEVAALANEISGETAKRNLEGIARFHRQRGSKGFHEAAGLVAERLRAYGLSDVAILQFPADGRIFYGTQRSRPGWDAEMAQLLELDSVAANCYEAAHEKPQSDDEARKVIAVLLTEECDPKLHPERLVASYETEPVVLAEDSESADVTVELVDVGEGTKESDYSGKDVKGKIVLVRAQPGAVQDMAVGKFGALGIVSYAQNQKTAWSEENLDEIRWGHLETFSANKTFAFMVSLRTARGFQKRLAKGQQIKLHAVVKAGQHAGNYEVVTATIPGADAKLKEEEIVFSCHLDHQRPGANDNASGCAGILEVGRTLQKLIEEKKLERPARTIRFVFPPEIEGTMALLNSDYEKIVPLIPVKKIPPSDTDGEIFVDHVEPATAFYPYYQRIKAVVHMDMVGGGPETKAVFHVTRGPMSLPSVVQDVAWGFAEWVNEESYEYAATGKAEYPLVSAEGGKEPLRAEYSAYTMGSDHDVYQDSSFGIPAIYLNDWPDRYIHTNLDATANIDATKLKRVAFIAAASGYFLAGRSDASAKSLSELSIVAKGGELQGQLDREYRVRSLEPNEAGVMNTGSCQYEAGVQKEIRAMIEKLPGDSYEGPLRELPKCWTAYSTAAKLSAEQRIAMKFKVKRSVVFKGPMAVFGFDYFEAEWTKRGHASKPKLLEFAGLWGGGEEYAYEVLNFVDGKRNAQEIRDAVSAEYGPVPLELVVEYLEALEEIRVVKVVK